jgi:hypothetical protein
MRLRAGTDDALPAFCELDGSLRLPSVPAQGRRLSYRQGRRLVFCEAPKLSLALVASLSIQMTRGTNWVSRKFTGISVMEEFMRRYIFAIGTAAIFAIPTAAFSESVYISPGGVRIGPSHHGYYNRYEGGGRCAELRQACLHKEQLVEQGMGNCQRYRAMCH